MHPDETGAENGNVVSTTAATDVREDAESAVEAKRQSLPSGRRIANAASMEVISYGVSVVLRLASNLILTRLLEPEAFGLMALLTSVVVVLSLLSEVGLSQAVVMSPNGDDPKFLNTVFTLQAVRGLILWVSTCLLAWPLSIFFGQADLIWMLPIGGASVLIHGFGSTRPYTQRRKLKVLPIVLVELFSSFCGLIVGVVGASNGYGIKALVAAVLTSAVIVAVCSHFLPDSKHRVRFGIDKHSQHEILHFGRWIFFSSVLTAISERGDQMLLAKLLGVSMLGLYNIALTLAEMPAMLVGKVLYGAIYPALARAKDAEPAKFGEVYYRLRLYLDPPAHVVLGGLMGMSDFIVGLMYDDRYHAASAMLRILAIRASINVMASTCEYGFIALGQSKVSFRRNLVVSIVLMLSLPIGDWVAGGPGVLWASVVARSTALLALWPEARKRGFFRPSRELLVLPCIGVGYALGVGLDWLLPDPVSIRAALRALFGMH